MNDDFRRSYVANPERPDTWQNNVVIITTIIAIIVSLSALFFSYRTYVAAKEAAKYCRNTYYASPYSDPVFQGNAMVGGGRNIEDGYSDKQVYYVETEKRNPPTPDPNYDSENVKPAPEHYAETGKLNPPTPDPNYDSENVKPAPELPRTSENIPQPIPQPD